MDAGGLACAAIGNRLRTFFGGSRCRVVGLGMECFRFCSSDRELMLGAVRV